MKDTNIKYQTKWHQQTFLTMNTNKYRQTKKNIKTV